MRNIAYNTSHKNSMSISMSKIGVQHLLSKTKIMLIQYSTDHVRDFVKVNILFSLQLVMFL